MRNGKSPSPRNGRKFKTGWNQSGNSGNGSTIPPKKKPSQAIIILMPRPEMVQNMVMDIIVAMAELKSTAAAKQAIPADALEIPGHFIHPAIDAMNIIGIERNAVGATRVAIARLYHRLKRSTGLRSS